ncbi:MAG TPA: type 1 glutamine amidotransferase domain-containing protein [Terracidiphilus sp.]|jgi:putative intracellular protease/amidase
MSNRESLAEQHREVLDLTRAINVLMVVANPTTHPVLGWPLGFWAAELIHPWVEFTDAGYKVTIASPNGGKAEVDGLSDPRDPSRWSASDIVSLGFLSSPDCVALLEKTPRLGSADLNNYDALVVCGGQSPMYTFRDNVDLKNAILQFYGSGKITGIFCHGVAALVDVKLPDGKYLVEGKTVTGFANVEEEYSDAFVGEKVMPWRLEDALKERGANYVQGGRFKAFCVRDGNLITGQQQYSGRRVARMIVAALGS